MILHLPHASYAYKSYWLCDRCDRNFMLKNQLSSMTSKRSHHLIKFLMLIGVSIKQTLRLQRCHRLTMLLILWLIKNSSCWKMVRRICKIIVTLDFIFWLVLYSHRDVSFNIRNVSFNIICLDVLECI